MKGQFFIIAAVIILIGFILLRSSTSIFDTLSERRIVESSLSNKQAENILNEYRYLIGVASLQSDVNRSAIEYLYNFSSFLRDERNVEILYVFAFVNGSTNNYSVTVGNFLKDNINVTLNATNSTPELTNFVIDDIRNRTTNLIANLNTTINITLTYVRIDTTITERLFIDPVKNMSAGFFDITIAEKSRIRVKEVYNVTIV